MAIEIHVISIRCQHWDYADQAINESVHQKDKDFGKEIIQTEKNCALEPFAGGVPVVPSAGPKVARFQSWVQSRASPHSQLYKMTTPMPAVGTGINWHITSGTVRCRVISATSLAPKGTVLLHNTPNFSFYTPISPRRASIPLRAKSHIFFCLSRVAVRSSNRYHWIFRPVR
jgi:hypothetical protein